MLPLWSSISFTYKTSDDKAKDDKPKNDTGTFSAGGPSSPHPDAFIPANTLLHVDQDDSQIPDLEDTAKLRSTDHPKDQILGDPKSAVQPRGMAKKSFGAHAFVSYIHKQRRTNHKDYENCLFSCFLSQMEPKKVTPKLSHLYAVKRIFRYLKGQPKLGLWYPRDSLFDMEAYSDSDYAGANLDRKFTTG
nr:uncharacterized mitochondrial protein AtMg00810-like [Tanacetum cinerariifolium]